ncbi:MAG: ice-binding family protein [Patescibacteria group bacterium]|jgi:hypothetical protein
MKVFKKIKYFVVLLLILLLQFTFMVPQTNAATTAVNLLTTDNFAVLAHTSITDVPTSSISGDVGLSAGASITGLTCSEVTGTIYDGDSGYIGACRVTNAAKLTQAETDLGTASTDASGRTPTTTYVTTNNQLGGKTLTTGVYAFGHGDTNNLTGTLTLDGEGDSNAVFIFQASSDLVTASNSVVSLTNSAQACNVFWVVSSQATLGSSSTFIGTIMAGTSVVLNTSANLNGRALARTAAVTLDSNTITKPTCTTPTPTPTSTTSSSSSSSSSTSTPVCVDSVPTNTPNLFQIDRAGSKATLYFSPVSGNLSYYFIAYGLSPGSEQYGVSFPAGLSTGVASYTINDLDPNTAYYFKVRGGNGCAPGGWSNNKESNSKNPALPNTGFGH